MYVFWRPLSSQISNKSEWDTTLGIHAVKDGMPYVVISLVQIKTGEILDVSSYNSNSSMYSK